jgi:hypothetical protein
MSLFKARDWWVANVGASEEFDGGALCVGNLDNDPNETGTVLVIRDPRLIWVQLKVKGFTSSSQSQQKHSSVGPCSERPKMGSA